MRIKIVASMLLLITVCQFPGFWEIIFCVIMGIVKPHPNKNMPLWALPKWGRGVGLGFWWWWWWWSWRAKVHFTDFWGILPDITTAHPGWEMAKQKLRSNSKSFPWKWYQYHPKYDFPQPVGFIYEAYLPMSEYWYQLACFVLSQTSPPLSLIFWKKKLQNFTLNFDKNGKFQLKNPILWNLSHFLT